MVDDVNLASAPSAYVLEPYHIFVEALVDALLAAGIHVVRVSNRFDANEVAALAPAIVFLDLDAGPGLPFPDEFVSLARVAAPQSAIVVYTLDAPARYESAGADEVISKSLDIDLFVDRMRRLRTGQRR